MSWYWPQGHHKFFPGVFGRWNYCFVCLLVLSYYVPFFLNYKFVCLLFVLFFRLFTAQLRSLFYCFQGSTLAALYSSKGSVLEVLAVWLLLLLLLMFLFLFVFFFPFSVTSTKTSKLRDGAIWRNWPQIAFDIARTIGKKIQIPLKQTMNSNFYWNWSQLKAIHQLNSLERHLKALITLVGDTWAAQPVWFSKTNGLVSGVTRLVIFLRKADSALMYCVHVLKLSLGCERIMVASFTVCKTDWHLLYLLFCRDIILLKPCASSTQRVVIFSRI